MGEAFLWVGLAVLLLGALWVIAIRNRFVRVRAHVRESWAGIDIELKRRYELIPNLVTAVKGYADHERTVLDSVLELRARAAANHGSAASQARDENALLAGLRQVFAVAEGYPQLRSDRNFVALQEELDNTEDRIAAARRFYNGNVRELRTLQESFPTNLVAATLALGDVSFFDLDDANERVVPRVRLQEGA
jgi:LemA protein